MGGTRSPFITKLLHYISSNNVHAFERNWTSTDLSSNSFSSISRNSLKTRGLSLKRLLTFRSNLSQACWPCMDTVSKKDDQHRNCPRCVVDGLLLAGTKQRTDGFLISHRIFGHLHARRMIENSRKMIVGRLPSLLRCQQLMPEWAPSWGRSEDGFQTGSCRRISKHLDFFFLRFWTFQSSAWASWKVVISPTLPKKEENDGVTETRTPATRTRVDLRVRPRVHLMLFSYLQAF